MKLVAAVIKPFKLGQIGNSKTLVLDLQKAVRMRAGEPSTPAI